jgi:reactive intermediate/imine deaminase
MEKVIEKASRILGTKDVAASDGTWSQCTRRGNLLFISGQIALNAQGEIVGRGDFAMQAQQALENLMAMLEAGGGKAEDLMSITVFLTDIRNRPLFAKIRKSFFQANPPASTLVEVNHLVMEELLIEINGIAVLGS